MKKLIITVCAAALCQAWAFAADAPQKTKVILETVDKDRLWELVETSIANM